MKKIIGIILSISIIIGMYVPAFATVNETHNSDDCSTYPVIIVRGMDFGGLTVDYGTENAVPAINADIPEIIKDVFKAVFTGLFTFSLDNAFDVVLDCAYNIFKYMAMDKNGDSVYKIGIPEYPQSADNYEDLCTGEWGEFGMVRTCIEKLPEGHTYYFNYDWRLDPFVVSDKINTLVNTAITETGHDKVNIVCCSMGGQMTLAYLTEYGYEKVNRCLFMSSTFCGAQVASDLLCGRLEITADNLYNFLASLVSEQPALEFLIDGLYKIGAFKGLTKITDFVIENYKQDIYDKVLKPVFCNMLPLWGLVQTEDYEAAKEYVFGDKTDEYASLISKADKLQNMMKGRTDLINNMIDDGVEIAVVAHYDAPLAPVYENADFNGDGTLETYQMSGYATVAKYGETLGDDYVAENPKYLSPDRVVDLSTALFPEYTYIIKGATHVGGNYGSEYADFLIWLLTYDGEFYAGASERYPQFMVSDSELTLSKFE